MNDTKKKQKKSSGGGYRAAEAFPMKSLADCILNTWKDLRNALEVGAAEQNYMTASELIADEEINVNLKIINPRTLTEEKLTDANVRKFMGIELAELATRRQVAMERAERRAKAAQDAPPEEIQDDEAEEGAEGGSDDDTVHVDDEAEANDEADDDPDNDDDDDEHDFLLNQEVYDSQKALIVNRYNEESKLLRKEQQKLILDRQKVIRNFHEVFVKEKNSGLYLRYQQKHGSVSKQGNVIEYVKQIKKLLFNLENKVGFEREREVQNIFEKWKEKKMRHVEQIVTEAKRLKEYNEDCEDLGCQSKKCEEEKGLFLMCEKLSGGLYSVGVETKAKIRDRRAALDTAETEVERKQIRRIYPNLPERVDQLFGYVSALVPKEEKQIHGKGMMYMSLYPSNDDG